MPKHDYGDRQARADMLVSRLRNGPADIPPYRDMLTGRLLSAHQLADEIEAGTDTGKGLVAVAGIVLHAMLSPAWEGARVRSVEGDDGGMDGKVARMDDRIARLEATIETLSKYTGPVATDLRARRQQELDWLRAKKASVQ